MTCLNYTLKDIDYYPILLEQVNQLSIDSLPKGLSISPLFDSFLFSSRLYGHVNDSQYLYNDRLTSPNILV